MDALPIGEFCTLPTTAQPMRLLEFDELFRRQANPPSRIGQHQVEFSFADAEGLYAEISDLVARESACCSFFDFKMERAAYQDQLVLRVGVPASRQEVLEALMNRAVAAVAEPTPTKGRPLPFTEIARVSARVSAATKEAVASLDCTVPDTNVENQ